MGRDGMATQPWVVMVWQHRFAPLGWDPKEEIPVGKLPPWVGIQKRNSCGKLAPMGPKFACCCAAHFLSKKLAFPHFLGPTWVRKKLRSRGWDTPSEIRAEILCLLAVGRVQMVARRPIWWQKNVIWGPLGFRAQLAHPWEVRAEAGENI